MREKLPSKNLRLELSCAWRDLNLIENDYTKKFSIKLILHKWHKLFNKVNIYLRNLNLFFSSMRFSKLDRNDFTSVWKSLAALVFSKNTTKISITSKILELSMLWVNRFKLNSILSEAYQQFSSTFFNFWRKY